MKFKNYNILVLVVLLMLFLSCSKEDDFQLLDPEMMFVNSDGTQVLDGDCLDSNKTYALQITLLSNGGGEFKSKEVVEYTINGVVYSVTFTELGSKTIPVNFINGTNVAQLIESGNSISIDVEFCSAVIVANKISFVYADGSEIPTGECLDLNSSYAIKIETERGGTGDLEPTKIDYTLNGVVYSTTFTEITTKLVSITVAAGKNAVQLISSGLTAELDLVSNCNAKIVANKISFVYADGSEIPEGECLDLNLNYAIKIETEKVGSGDLESTKIDYTLNGVTYSTTFTEITTKLVPVKVSAGENVSQIIGTSIISTINFVDQGNFELV